MPKAPTTNNPRKKRCRKCKGKAVRPPKPPTTNNQKK